MSQIFNNFLCLIGNILTSFDNIDGTSIPDNVRNIAARISPTADAGINWTAIIATLTGFFIGMGGLYLNYKSRTASLREKLHSSQINLLIDTVEPTWRACLLCLEVLREKDNPHEIAKIMNANGDVLGKIQKLTFNAAIILPSSSVEAIENFAEIITLCCDPDAKTSDRPTIDEVFASHAKFVSAARKDLGVDVLSEEARKLFRQK